MTDERRKALEAWDTVLRVIRESANKPTQSDLADEFETIRQALTEPAVPDAVRELVQQLRAEAANRCGCYDSDNPMPGCDCYNAGDTFSEGVNQARLEIAGRLERALAQQGERNTSESLLSRGLRMRSALERAGVEIREEGS